jgi:hypothetical protein
LSCALRMKIGSLSSILGIVNFPYLPDIAIPHLLI